jgi:DNA (cytosine-5)-methyltransferase 1
LLDAFCGAGGCTKGYQEAGFYVVGVDIKPQPNYCGDEFLRADALGVLEGIVSAIEHGREPMNGLIGSFAAVHASPPCQAHSDLAHHPQNRENDYPELIGPTRELLVATGLPYVIENVPGAPLINPTMLCGSAFGLGVRRHRLFETSFPMMSPGCSHGSQAAQFDVYEHGRWFKSPVARVYGNGGGKGEDRWPEAMGIDWMTRPELAQAIPPAMTAHVGTYLLNAIEAQKRVPA